MSLNTKNSYKLSVKRARRRRRRLGRVSPLLRTRSRACIARRILNRMEGKSKLSHKLRALKKLIPAQSRETVKVDQLFKETADYIVLLRTQVVILQNLIKYYGNSSEIENTVS